MDKQFTPHYFLMVIFIVLLSFGIILSGCDPGNGSTTTYTVTFNSNGGTEIPSISGISSGSTIILPANPTKADHTFASWFIDNGTFQNEFTASTPVTQNIIVYAKWLPVSDLSIFIVQNQQIYVVTAYSPINWRDITSSDAVYNSNISGYIYNRTSGIDGTEEPGLESIAIGSIQNGKISMTVNKPSDATLDVIANRGMESSNSELKALIIMGFGTDVSDWGIGLFDIEKTAQVCPLYASVDATITKIKLGSAEAVSVNLNVKEGWNFIKNDGTTIEIYTGAVVICGSDYDT
jgi:uncharacterized repeat protein (TIGR02543 family)